MPECQIELYVFAFRTVLPTRHSCSMCIVLNTRDFSKKDQLNGKLTFFKFIKQTQSMEMTVLILLNS